GTGQGRQPSLDLDVANVGRFCRAVLDAGMGHLDHRWLAPVARRLVTRSGNEALVMKDAVHMPIPICQAIQEEERHGYCEREDGSRRSATATLWIGRAHAGVRLPLCFRWPPRRSRREHHLHDALELGLDVLGQHALAQGLPQISVEGCLIEAVALCVGLL